jgi:hypothetical protein
LGDVGRGLELLDDVFPDGARRVALRASLGGDADSDVGSWKPPADRLLVTGIPKIAVPTMTSKATAMIRRGAARASRAIP